jgi:hypothetical protein
MSKLTDEDRKLIERKWEDSCVRPPEQWRQIIDAEPTPEDAAARIFGDLVCYRSDRGASNERRPGFIGDVQNLANVIRALQMKDAP